MKRTDTMDENAYGQFTAFLASKLGLTPADVSHGVGPRSNGRTRAQVASDLAAWLRDRPRA